MSSEIIKMKGVGGLWARYFFDTLVPFFDSRYAFFFFMGPRKYIRPQKVSWKETGGVVKKYIFFSTPPPSTFHRKRRRRRRKKKKDECLHVKGGRGAKSIIGVQRMPPSGKIKMF